MPDILIDDRELEIPPLSEVCTFCGYLIDSGINRTCKAFPNGIPMEIWKGNNNHREPYPGDLGITFKKVKE